MSWVYIVLAILVVGYLFEVFGGDKSKSGDQKKGWSKLAADIYEAAESLDKASSEWVKKAEEYKKEKIEEIRREKLERLRALRLQSEALQKVSKVATQEVETSRLEISSKNELMNDGQTKSVR